MLPACHGNSLSGEQMCNMTYNEQSDLLAGQIGLLKGLATNSK
jgi:hypothetical protein